MMNIDYKGSIGKSNTMKQGSPSIRKLSSVHKESIDEELISNNNNKINNHLGTELQPKPQTSNKKTSISKNSYKSYNLEKNNQYKEENNNYAKHRINNISYLNDQPNTLCRKPNLVLYQIILEDITKPKIIRDNDILATKIPSYITNYSNLSLQGNHSTFGEMINVNQDSCFCYENFLLLRNVYLFGVCDGHGEYGHFVSNHAKIYLPLNMQYIEIDNNITKRNKNMNKLLSSLYTLNENSNVKDTNIMKYLYDKFSMNMNDMSCYKKSFSDINALFKEAFKATQEDLLKREFNSITSGSTMCTLLINGKYLYCANIGDSRAILCSCSGYDNWSTSQLTKDHKPSDSEESNRIVNSKGKVQRFFDEDQEKEIGPYRVWFEEESKGPGLAMSRSLGDNAAKKIGVIAEPDVYEYSLNQNDKFIIIASDGVWDYISNEKALDIVKPIYLDNTKSSIDACSTLTKAATNEWIKVLLLII